ncbi:MAG: hypothetical protein LZ167_07775 [Thaumarchaeota archaeon]|nr:hypothetical protein [Candidatus Geocrenenecus arthurdayi]MCL7397294.1 hypothetical protein [Candidatus Geocrenenecus arthurdayi]
MSRKEYIFVTSINHEMKIPSYILYLLILVVAVGFFLSGYYLSQYQLGSQLSINMAELEEARSRNLGLTSRVRVLEDRVLQLESEKISLAVEAEKLNQELSKLIEELEDKSKEIAGMNSSCTGCYRELSEIKNNLKKLTLAIDKLRQDRELLVILKSEPPRNRTEAKIYWNDTRAGLYRINPNLIPTVDTIIYYLDYYFDWVESFPRDANQERVCNWIFSYTTEAREYESAISKLRDEIYLTVLTDLGEVLRIMEEISTP